MASAGQPALLRRAVAATTTTTTTTMSRLPRPSTLLTASLSILSLCPLAAAAITKCPTDVNTYTDPASGAVYAICPGTNYDVAAAKMTGNVSSSIACAQVCEQDGTCLFAAYSSQTRTCNFVDRATAGRRNWVEDAAFSAIYYDNQLPELTVVASCPFKQASTTAGDTTFNVCPHTDIRGLAVRSVKDVANTEACALECASTTGCSMASYDTVGRICHVKADDKANAMVWHTSKRYTSIRQKLAEDPATDGAWSDLVRLPVIPVAAFIVPEFPEASRMLVFSSWGNTSFGGSGGLTQFADYNFKTGAVSARTVSNTKHDMFCPGMSCLDDGRLLITGGSSAEVTSFYDPTTNEFTRGPDMKMGRGYQTSTTLSDGRVFVIGGAYTGRRVSKPGEVYDPASETWTMLPGAKIEPMLTDDAEGVWREDNHGWLVAWKNASVFQAGPSRNQNWYGTRGQGSQSAAGVRDIDDAMCGVWVMYEPGKIFSAGGSPDYTDSDAVKRAHITTITEPGAPSTVERVADMQYARGFANGVVLPDGKILVTGGQKRSIVFSDRDSVLWPEMFDPATKTWKTLASEAAPRNYHSVSILLPDGRVFSGGGGLCFVNVPFAAYNCDKTVDHPDGQIYSPPYLFTAGGNAATRPELSKLRANTVKVGGEITVDVDMDKSQLVLIRIGSVTHSVNSDQRRVPLDDVKVAGKTYTAALPKDSGILLPGYWYLFAVSEAGVPSIARTVRITL